MSDAAPRTYVLNYRVSDESQIKILDRWLHDSWEISSVTSPIPLVYFFKSHLLASDISKKMSFLFPNGQFTIAEINVMNIDGYMPKSAWDWFYQRDAEAPSALSKLGQI